MRVLLQWIRSEGKEGSPGSTGFDSGSRFYWNFRSDDPKFRPQPESSSTGDLFVHGSVFVDTTGRFGPYRGPTNRPLTPVVVYRGRRTLVPVSSWYLPISSYPHSNPGGRV